MKFIIQTDKSHFSDSSGAKDEDFLDILKNRLCYTISTVGFYNRMNINNAFCWFGI